MFDLIFSIFAAVILSMFGLGLFILGSNIEGFIAFIGLTVFGIIIVLFMGGIL